MSMKLFKRRGNRRLDNSSGPRRLEMIKTTKETKKMEKMENNNNNNNNNSKSDTLQVDPIKVAEATIAFMNVDNANLNLVNKKLIAENKILEIMGLVGVSPNEYRYNPQTGSLEKVKEPVKETVSEPVATTDPTPTPTS